MSAVLAALLAGVGMYLLVTAVLFGWPGRAPRPAARLGRLKARREARRGWLAQAGLAEVGTAEFLGVVGLLGLAGGGLGYAVFGSPLPAVAAALALAASPIALYRNRRRTRRERAADDWPHLIDELRLRATSLGRSLPQALFEVGAGAPPELRSAFAAAQREWLISTDFGRALDVVRARLADATADVVCETLLIAHELGGTDLGPRLAALADDRRLEVAGRKDARAKQAGVRFARRFVLIVPLGMAAAGSLIGTGRRAYGTTAGQILVLLAMALMAGCWLWAGRFLRLPEPGRVLSSPQPPGVAVAAEGRP